jgi:biotin carboxylase
VLCHPSYRSPHAYSQFVANRIEFDWFAGSRDERADKLLSLLTRESVDLVIPISDEDAHLLALCKLKAPELTAIISSGLENVELARRRDRTLNFCQQNGIVIPESCMVHTKEELFLRVRQLGFPAVVKTSYSVSSKGVRVIHNESDLQQISSWINDEQPLQVQEFVQWDFVGSSGFAWKGKLLSSFSFRVAYQFSMGGTSPYSFYESSEAPAKILEKIAQRSGWTGGIDLDFIQDKYDTLHLLEINPRLSGTITLPFKLGHDLARYYEAALDESFDKMPPAPLSPAETILFISVPDEIKLISSDPAVNFPKSMQYRRQCRFIESLFLDDAALTRNQITQFLQMAWADSKGL